MPKFQLTLNLEHTRVLDAVITNINQNIEICILCGSLRQTSVTDKTWEATRKWMWQNFWRNCLRMCPRLASKFLFFCCPQCKRLFEKRQKLLDNVASTEAELRERRNAKCVRIRRMKRLEQIVSQRATKLRTQHMLNQTQVGLLHSSPLASRHSGANLLCSVSPSTWGWCISPVTVWHTTSTSSAVRRAILLKPKGFRLRNLVYKQPNAQTT